MFLKEEKTCYIKMVYYTLYLGFKPIARIAQAKN